MTEETRQRRIIVNRVWQQCQQLLKEQDEVLFHIKADELSYVLKCRTLKQVTDHLIESDARTDELIINELKHQGIEIPDELNPN